MSTADESPTVEAAPPGVLRSLRDPGVRAYALIGLAALVVLFLMVMDRGVAGALGGLVILILGLAGLVTGWRTVPPAILFVVTVSQVDWWGGHWPEFLFDLNDLLLCGALLVYLAAQFRLFGLTGNVLPPEPGVAGSGGPRMVRRSSALVSDRELAFLGVLAAWVVLAQGLWAVLPESLDIVRSVPGLVRLFILAVVLGGGGLAVSAVLGYLSLRRATPAEALQVLQDELWDETRSEQRALNRWLAWARLRARRGVLDLTPRPPSLRGKGETRAPAPGARASPGGSDPSLPLPS
jgi:hypothetical protein